MLSLGFIFISGPLGGMGRRYCLGVEGGWLGDAGIEGFGVGSWSAWNELGWLGLVLGGVFVLRILCTLSYLSARNSCRIG